MKKIIVKGSKEEIKNNLSPMKDEVCIVFNRGTKDVFILAFDDNVELIGNLLSIASVEEFTEESRIAFIMSEDNYVMSGRKDFLH